MDEQELEKTKDFTRYLKKSGLIYFYDSLKNPFLLLDINTARILYANNPALKIFNKGVGFPFYENFKNSEKKKLTSLLEKIKNNELDHFVYEFSLPGQKLPCILRFQKVNIAKNRLIVIFSTENDPVYAKSADNLGLESNYLNTLYHISKIIGNLHKNEEETFLEIANTISKLFVNKTIWVRLKINNKYYASENFTDSNRIYSRRINAPDNAVAFMEIGLTQKIPRFKGIHFTVDEEKVFDEIIERIEDALLEKSLRDKLSQNEKRFRSIIENAGDAIIVTDKEGKIIDANKKSEEIFGLPQNQLLAQNIKKLIRNLKDEEIEKFLETSSNSAEAVPAPIEKTVYNAKHATMLFCEITVASWDLEQKTYYSFFIRDVTIRKKSEAFILYRSKFEQIMAKIAAKFIESGFRGIEISIEYALKTLAVFLGASRACIYELNTETQKISCSYEWSSPGTKRLISFSQNLEIKQFSGILNQLTSQSVMTISRQTAEKSFKPYLKLRKVQSVLGIAFYQQDKFAGFIGFEFKDKTYELKDEDIPLLSLYSKMLGNEIQQFKYELERREFEMQMRKMHEAIRQSGNVIVITDTDGNIEYVNPKFEEVTEYKAEEVIGKNPRILKSGYTTKEEYEKLWKTITSGKEWRGVFKNKTKSGKFFWENVIISPIKNEQGEIINFLAVKEDITEQIQMKNQLDLARKMEAIGQLAAGIAHEINTPMQFISDNIEFLQKGFDNYLNYYRDVAVKLEKLFGKEAYEKFISEITPLREKYDINYLKEEIPAAIEQTYEGIARVTKIIKTMKDFSHPSSGEKAPADINKAISDTVLLTRNVWKYSSELKTELCENPPLINCAIDQINQALLNIIVNAAQAIEEKFGRTGNKKGLIVIRTDCNEDSLKIKISDNGVGIPQEYIDKIYEPFFTTKEVGKGTGQGLALVHDIIVNKHGGSITVESEVNVGTTFTITLPIK